MLFFVCYYAGKYKAYSDIYEKVLNEHVKRHFEEEFKDDIKNKINKGQKQMEVKFNAGDMCAIPDGCKATIKDGIVIFEKDFEDGDVLHSVYDDLMLIYKEGSSSESFSSHFNTAHNYNFGWNIHSFRHATEEEKQLLFDKMKEQDLRWNAEEKRVEKLLWRADAGEEYYFINSSLNVMKIEECWSVLCGEHYSASNYFHTKEQAEEAARRVKEVLRNYHEEIKE